MAFDLGPGFGATVPLTSWQVLMFILTIAVTWRYYCR